MATVDKPTHSTSPAALSRTHLVKELVDRLTDDHLNQRLQLPTLPDIALRIRNAVADEGKGIPDIARLVQADPTIALKVIQVANSARFANLRPADSTQTAVARIGLTQTRDLVISLSMRTLFGARSPVIALRMKELWRHSVRVASISRVLAGIGPELDPERGTLAGLVHDVGALPVLGYATHYPQLLEDSQLLDHVIQRLRGRIGSLVLRSWEFDEALTTIPLAVDNWSRDPRPMPDYGDVVLLANIFARFGSQRTYDGPPMVTLPAFNKFPLGALGPEGGVEVLELARDEINATMQMLNADGS